MERDPKSPKLSCYLIVGGGPVGAVLAAHLKHQGSRVALYDLDELVLAGIKTRGLVVDGAANLHVSPTELWTDLSKMDRIECKAVFIAVKALSTAAVARSLAGRLVATVPIVNLQNGLDAELPLQRLLPQNPLLQLVVNWGGEREGPGRYRMTFFNRPNYIAGLDRQHHDSAAALAAMLTQAGLDTLAVEDLSPYLWRKTILTSAIAPVTGVFGVTIGQALDDPESRGLVEALVAEGAAVARAAHIDIGHDFEKNAVPILRKSSTHRSSMSVDLAMGRRTEIHVFNEALIRRGAQLGVPTPVQTALAKMVRDKEAAGLRADGVLDHRTRNAG